MTHQHAFGVGRLSVPKLGEPTSQDYCNYNTASGLFAVADGATDSAFQLEWARILVESFLSFPPTDASSIEEWFRGWLPKCQQQWRSWLDDQLREGQVPWHGEAKARETGALSTFLGVSFTSEAWFALCVGDTCFLEFDSRFRLVRSWPVEAVSGFDSTPDLLASLEGRAVSHPVVVSGSILRDHYYVLATDALAKWLTIAAGGSSAVEDFLVGRKLEEEGTALRDRIRVGRIPNDDLTALIIRIDGSAPEADIASLDDTPAAVSDNLTETVLKATSAEKAEARLGERDGKRKRTKSVTVVGLAGIFLGLVLGAVGYWVILNWPSGGSGDTGTVSGVVSDSTSNADNGPVRKDAPSLVSHVISGGETFIGIARARGLSPDTLVALNQDLYPGRVSARDFDVLQIGDTLLVPRLELD